MSTATLYTYADGSAPTRLTGDAFAQLETILDAVLVNGYGAKSAAGWTKHYSDASRVAYRMSTAGTATGFYFVVDDSGTANWADVYMAEDVNSGSGVVTDPFPLSSTVHRVSPNASYGYWRIVADDRGLYLWNDNGLYTTPGSNFKQYYFGDINSWNEGADSYHCIATHSKGMIAYPGYYLTDASDSYIARDYTGVDKSVEIGCSSLAYMMNNFGGTGSGGPDSLGTKNITSNPLTGKVTHCEVYVGDTLQKSIIRGTMPGLRHIIENRPYTDFTTVTGDDGDDNGKSMVVFPTTPNSGTGESLGQMLIQYDTNWRA